MSTAGSQRGYWSQLWRTARPPVDAGGDGLFEWAAGAAGVAALLAMAAMTLAVGGLATVALLVKTLDLIFGAVA